MQPDIHLSSGDLYGNDPWNVKGKLITNEGYPIDKTAAKALLGVLFAEIPKLRSMAAQAQIPQLEPVVVAMGAAPELASWSEQLSSTLNNMASFFEQASRRVGYIVPVPYHDFMKETPKQVVEQISDDLKELRNGGTEKRWGEKYRNKDEQEAMNQYITDQKKQRAFFESDPQKIWENLKTQFLKHLFEYDGILAAGKICSNILSAMEFDQKMQELKTSIAKNPEIVTGKCYDKNYGALRDSMKFLADQTDVLHVLYMVQKTPEDKVTCLRLYLAEMGNLCK